MEFELLEYKPKVIDKNGNEIYDLTKRSINYDQDQDVDIIDGFLVGSDMKMRPDLISYLAYNNVDHFALLLKFNGISNPFSIDEGDYIFIPSLSYMQQQLDKKTEDPKKNIYKQYIDPSKKPIFNPRKTEYLNKVDKLKNIKSDRISKYNLPPNLAEPGSTEAKLGKQGVIYLGESE